MRKDLLSAYAAAGAKVLSWVIIAGLVYRWGDALQFTLLAFVRGTLGLLNYITFGIAPAIMRLTSQAARQPMPVTSVEDDTQLAYATPHRLTPIQVVYSNAIFVSIISLLLGVVLIAFYGYYFDRIFSASVAISRETLLYVLVYMGLGLLLRLLSETPGAVLQSRGRIPFDSGCVVLGEASWVILTLVMLPIRSGISVAATCAMAFFFSAILQLLPRLIGAAKVTESRFINLRVLHTPMMLNLLGFGLLVTLAQLADYLYAPVDYLIISKFLDPLDIAVFAPAVQIDAGLLLLVSGLAAVVLPKTAIADANRDRAAIRRYCIKGTLLSAGLLLGAAIVVWLASPWIFRVWFGAPMEKTQEILPLMLVATVVGGSSAVGRSVLLGMGKVKGFTIAALTAGIMNVVLAYTFAVPLNWGLKGILMGTVIVVTIRCAIWMPWYVLRSLRSVDAGSELPVEAATPPAPPEFS